MELKALKPVIHVFARGQTEEILFIRTDKKAEEIIRRRGSSGATLAERAFDATVEGRKHSDFCVTNFQNLGLWVFTVSNEGHYHWAVITASYQAGMDLLNMGPVDVLVS